MHRKSFFVLLTVVLIAYSVQRTTAFGADSVASPTPKIGMVRLSRLLEAYEGAKSSETKLEGFSKTKQEERERMISEIKGLRDELVLLNEEARLERQETIDEKLGQLAGFDRRARESLRKQREEAVRVVLDEIEAVITDYARERGFTLILNEQAVLYGQEALDVTEDVLTILNERYKKGKK